MSEQAQAASPATAASSDAGTPQIDVENVSMEQLNQLFETGSAELPVKSGGEEKKSQEAAPAKPKAQDPPAKVEPLAKVGDEPPKAEGAVEEVVEETRTPEEIETAVTAAVEAVKTEGGDQAAQDAAAEAARQPVKAEATAAKEEPVPAKAKEEPDAEKSRRFRVKDPIAQAALEIYKTFENTDTPITLAEAERRVRGGDAAPKKEAAKEAGPDLTVVVSTLETEVAEIERKLVEAGGDEGLYNAEIAKLNIEHNKKSVALESAKRDLRDEQESAQLEAADAEAVRKKTVADSRARAIKQYPDVADDATPLGKAVAERIEAMRSKDHPEHELLFVSSAAEVITMKVANELGIQPKTEAKTVTPPPAKTKETPPKPKKVEPASGALSSAAAAPKPEDATKAVEYLKSDKATLAELDAAFGATNPLQAMPV